MPLPRLMVPVCFFWFLFLRCCLLPVSCCLICPRFGFLAKKNVLFSSFFAVAFILFGATVYTEWIACFVGFFCVTVCFFVLACCVCVCPDLMFPHIPYILPNNPLWSVQPSLSSSCCFTPRHHIQKHALVVHFCILLHYFDIHT